MAQRYRVRSLGKGAGSDQPDEMGGGSLLLDNSLELDDDAEEAASGDPQADPPLPGRGGSGALPMALAMIALAGWSGFYAWAVRGEFAAVAGTPRLAAAMVAEWAVPVVLIGIAWLIALRHSRAEAGRFAESAAMLREESATLETRLVTVNRELSLAREFLASQSQELEALGRIAAERIGRHAAELQELIRHNGAEVNSIATTSESALANMNRLRDDLPVVANAARDATNQIGNAGRTALDQADKLIAAFARLNQFGTATAAEVGKLEARVEATLGSFDEQIARVEAIVTGRFAEARREAESFAEQLAAAEDAARQQLKDRFATLHHEMLEKLSMVEDADRAIAASAEQRLEQIRAEMNEITARIAADERHFAEAVEQCQAAFETREAQASEVLSQRLAALDDALAQRREAQLAETEKLVATSTAMAGQLDALGELIARIQQASLAARSELGSGLDALAEQLAAKQTALAATQADLGALTDASVRLLEIIQSGARFAREDLAASIAEASGQIAAAEARASGVEGLMLASASSGAQLDAYLIKAREEITATDAAIRELEAGLAQRSEDALARLAGLRGGFARLAEESGVLAQNSQEALRASLGEIETSIAASLAALEDVTANRLPAMAEGVGVEAVAALERALRIEAAATIGKLEQSAAHAAGIGREAVVQLRDQLAMVNELTGNLEQRVARAREQAEEQVNNDFARRMALITDSLNSAAIDITAALSTEVSDTAWQAYLKGDRGIFTRRAVRLIDAGTSRQITEMYERDEAFRGHVSRYIHDFEAMLRSLLSARGGNVMSVTMLGSDMGKLYVVLAQAIQRLRN
ncbi:MAG: ATPase [Erythrobacter sp.]